MKDILINGEGMSKHQQERATVLYAQNEGRDFDPISNDDVECWGWEHQDALIWLNETHPGHLYSWQNNIFVKQTK